MESSILIGDIIRDLEDGDCFYEGIVTSLNPIEYEITNITWDGETDSRLNGNITELKWWVLEKYINGKWIRISNLSNGND